MSFHAINF